MQIKRYSGVWYAPSIFHCVEYLHLDSGPKKRRREEKELIFLCQAKLELGSFAQERKLNSSSPSCDQTAQLSLFQQNANYLHPDWTQGSLSLFLSLLERIIKLPTFSMAPVAKKRWYRNRQKWSRFQQKNSWLGKKFSFFLSTCKVSRSNHACFRMLLGKKKVCTESPLLQLILQGEQSRTPELWWLFSRGAASALLF